jgi:hypothetical protein
MPAAKQAWRSSSKALAVMATIGTSARPAKLRSARVTTST